MSVVSLSKARKARERAKRKAQADANALKHGRTRGERDLEAARAEVIAKALDRAKTERP